MNQRHQQAQQKLPQAKVSAVSHNPELSIFFFFTVEKSSYRA